MSIQIKSFFELGPTEVYKILQLRFEVFVIEQDCIYPDVDDKDQESDHVFIMEDNTLCAYARVLPPRIVDEIHSSIGRVIVKKEYRHKGYGHLIFKACVDHALSKYPEYPINLHAQTYLEKFYSTYGFQPTGNYFLEDGLPHLEMVLEG